MRPLVLLLVLFSTAYTVSVSMELPAVSDGSRGSMVNLTLGIVDGNGNVFISIPPLMGESFQRSVLDSLEWTLPEEYVRSHNFYVIGSAGDAGSVIDGPSAGAALAVMAKSVSRGAKLAGNVTMTGGLDRSGSVLSVGGLPEKAETSALHGKDIILVPSVYLDDKAALDKVYSTLGISVIEYYDFPTAYSCLTGGDCPRAGISYPEADTSWPEDSPAATHNPLIYRMVGTMREELARETAHLEDTHPEAHSYFSGKSRLSDVLYAGGLTYSAGNEAFLSLYRVRMLNSNLSDEYFNGMRASVENCTANVKERLSLYNGPVEGYANTELRYHWAVLELEGFKHPQSVSERIHASYSLEKALLWCRLAESILKESSGTPGCTSEGALREISGRLIEAYRKAGDSGELLKAVDAYNAGRYGASLIEVAYYESSHNGSLDFSLNEYAHETDWGRMIYAHSLYINASSEYGSRSSLEVARLSLFTDMHLAEAGRASCFMLEEWRREERDDSYAAARNTLLILAPILIVLLVLRRVFRDEGF